MRRVDEAVREVLSDTIAKDLKDPRIGFVTVTAVNTSRDLRHARVYVSVLGDQRTREQTMEGLRSAHGYLQGEIANQLTLKRTPSLVFEYDETVERAARLTELMQRGPDRQDEPDPERRPDREDAPDPERGPDREDGQDREDGPDA